MIQEELRINPAEHALLERQTEQYGYIKPSMSWGEQFAIYRVCHGIKKEDREKVLEQSPEFIKDEMDGHTRVSVLIKAYKNKDNAQWVETMRKKAKTDWTKHDVRPGQVRGNFDCAPTRIKFVQRTTPDTLRSLPIRTAPFLSLREGLTGVIAVIASIPEAEWQETHRRILPFIRGVTDGRIIARTLRAGQRSAVTERAQHLVPPGLSPLEIVWILEAINRETAPAEKKETRSLIKAIKLFKSAAQKNERGSNDSSTTSR